jgi:hypothetical protein
MKKTLLYLFSGILLSTTLAFQSSGLCDASTIKAALKQELKPDYRYDSSSITPFKSSGEFQGKKIEVPLIGGEKFRFVFNTKGADKNFQIYVSNKKDGFKTGKVLFALKEVREEGKDIYVFEPEKSEKLYITYIVPPSLGEAHDFCAAFMIGYKL